MNHFSKLLLIPAVVVAIGAGVGIAAATDGGSGNHSGGSPATGLTAGDTTSPAVDVKGPCDEAEHAGDPRCTGAQVPEDDHDGTGAEPGDDDGQDQTAEAEDRNDDHGAGEDDASGASVEAGPGSSHDSGGDDSSEHGGFGHHGGNQGGDG
jgi:hypothetical protein